MRLGKSRSTLQAFEDTWPGGPRTLLVVTPAIGREVWRKEMQEMGLDLPVLTLYGTTRRRGWHDLPAAVPKVLVIAWDCLHAWTPFLQERLQDFVLVLDESHLTPTPSAKRWKAAKSLADRAGRVWELTGTPYKNSALDIYWQLKLLGRENPFHSWSPQQFGDEFCNRSWNAYAGPLTGQRYASGRAARAGAWEYKGLKAGAETDLLYRLQGLVDRKLLSDCLDVPRMRRIPCWLDQGQGFDGDPDDDTALAAARRELIPQKIEATLAYVQSLEERPLVIFGWHVELVEELARRLNAPKIHGGTPDGERRRIQQEFAEGKHSFLVANLIAAGTAIDLSSAAHAIFAEPDWSAVNHQQAEARILGPRQTAEAVTYSYILFSESVDEAVWYQRLRKGQAIQRLDSERAILTGVNGA